MNRAKRVVTGCLVQAVAVVILLVVVAVDTAATGQAAGAAQAALPTPESALGFRPGDDFKLANYDESLAYFRQLDAASDRLQLVEAGRTSEGRPWFFAVVSSPANLANLERYRQIAQRLPHPAGAADGGGPRR